LFEPILPLGLGGLVRHRLAPVRGRCWSGKPGL